MDAFVGGRDMEAAERDAFTSAPDGTVPPDAFVPPDGSEPVEDCTTDADDDGDGSAGCADGECFDETRCIEADLAERGLSDWTVCQSLTFEAEETSARCEEGLPELILDTEQELRCGLVPTEVQVDVYCPPEPMDDEEPVQMRWRLAMDLSGTDRMVGPNIYESTNYQPELVHSNTVSDSGTGGYGGDPLHPVVDHWGEDYRAIGWRSFPPGARFTAFTTVRVSVATFYVFDGGTTFEESSPESVYNAAFEVPSVGIGE